MTVRGAATHRLQFRRGRVVPARGEHQQLLDQTGAGAAAGAGLGVFAHLLQCEQAFFLDRFADRAFAHAVATAHLVGVGHGGGLALALVAHIADVGFAEHQSIAQVGDGSAFAHQFEVPTAVDRVAIQASTDQTNVLQDQFFVHPSGHITHHDLVALWPPHEFAGTE